jgi:hypothetical protein
MGSGSAREREVSVGGLCAIKPPDQLRDQRAEGQQGEDFHPTDTSSLLLSTLSLSHPPLTSSSLPLTPPPLTQQLWLALTQQLWG